MSAAKHHNPTHGQKVTTDPAGKENPIVEGTGVVTSDSLAADSDRHHGGFSDNRDSEPSSVPAKSSTASNTITSAAKVLAAAPDSEHRRDGTVEDNHHKGHNNHAERHKHHNDPKSHTQEAGHAAAAKSTSDVKAAPKHDEDAKHAGAQHHSHQHTGDHLNDDHGHVPIAPSYVQVARHVQHDPHNKPHGKDVKEVDTFEGEKQGKLKNASLNTGIGEKDDPARKAVDDIERQNATGGSEAGPRQKGLQGQGTYDALREE